MPCPDTGRARRSADARPHRIHVAHAGGVASVPDSTRPENADADRNHLVWTGDAIGRVTQRMPAERGEAAERAITAIFERYPYGPVPTAPAPAGR